LWDFCGSGVDGMKFLRRSLSPGGARAMGDAKENERALGPRMDDVELPAMVGPTLEDDVSVRLRYHGLRES